MSSNRVTKEQSPISTGDSDGEKGFLRGTTSLCRLSVSSRLAWPYTLKDQRLSEAWESWIFIHFCPIPYTAHLKKKIFKKQYIFIIKSGQMLKEENKITQNFSNHNLCYCFIDYAIFSSALFSVTFSPFFVYRICMCMLWFVLGELFICFKN